MSVTDDERNHAQLVIVLNEIVDTIEMLMLSGLTSVSPSIADRFQTAFGHAAKCHELRLSSNLRLVNQELKRFFEDDNHFSEKRLALFLNRCWQMSRQISQSGVKQTEQHNPETVEKLRVALHGVVKKTAPGVFVALEFRLRRLESSSGSSKPLLWSCVLAAPGDSKLSPETLLALDQPQKFKPDIFLKSTVCLHNIRLVEDDNAVRIQLGKDSEVLEEDALTPTGNWQDWSLAKVAGTLEAWQPTPLDLETQPQFEVYLDRWSIDKEFDHPGLENKIVFPLSASGKQMYLVIDNNDDGKGQLSYFRERLKGDRSDGNVLLFGLLHYEQGIGLFQPLTIWPQKKSKQSPKHLMITEDKSDYAALIKALK